MRRIVALAAFALACALWTSTSLASAEQGDLTGNVPGRGGFGLVVFAGGSIEDLDAAAAEQGCALRAAYAFSGGQFVGHLIGAPGFVNRGFAKRFPAGLSDRTPLIIACDAVPLAEAARAQPLEIHSSTEVIGTSVQGRSISVSCYGHGDRTLLLVGGIHTGPVEAVSSTLAREVSRAIRRGALIVPGGTRACIVEALNVDGLALGMRINAHGVDLNRNWPAASWSRTAYHPEGGEVSGGAQPLSEPETRALHEYVIATRPAAIVTWHCCGSVVEGNAAPGASGLAARYASSAGLAYIERWTEYPLSGQLLDGMNRLGIPAIDVEMERSDETASDQHLAGVLAVVHALAAAR